MAFYRKKPVVIEALQWDGSAHRTMHDFLGGNPDEYMRSTGEHFYIDHSKGEGGLVIRTSEGDMFASVGDFIIKEPFDKERMFYPCKPDIFEKTYEVVLIETKRKKFLDDNQIPYETVPINGDIIFIVDRAKLSEEQFKIMETYKP